MNKINKKMDKLIDDVEVDNEVDNEVDIENDNNIENYNDVENENDIESNDIVEDVVEADNEDDIRNNNDIENNTNYNDEYSKVEEEIKMKFYQEALIIYIKVANIEYNPTNFEDCSLVNYINLLFLECHYAKYEKYYDKYDFCSINIHVPCDSSPIMKLNITKDDILNTIEIGYNSLHKIIKNSKNFKLE